MEKNKLIFIIAGPNGAGKTTFASQFVPSVPQLTQFLNADLIAAGLSPFAPEREALQAGKLMVSQMDKAVRHGESFCLETTLAGRTYAGKIPRWQQLGYVVHLVFLGLPTPEMAIARVAARVQQGGHNITEEVIRRRFTAGLENFQRIYKNIVDIWSHYDNSCSPPDLLASGSRSIRPRDSNEPAPRIY